MRVLVAGASGLVGGRLLAALAGDDRTVVRAASRIVRKWPEGVEGVVIDPGVAGTLDIACRDVDVVVNLASMSEAACAADPGKALRATVGGTTALAVAAAAGVGRFIQLSTAKVYGDNLAGQVTEDTPTSPASPYATTHRLAEDGARKHPGAVILRLANGFGAPAGLPAAGWTVMVNEFCRQAVVTRRIAVYSDGRSWRNFVPMDDVIAALNAAATHLPAGTYNLGTAGATTIAEMAKRVAGECRQVLGLQPEVTLGPSTANEPAARLEFRSDRLRGAGVPLNASIDVEIRRTLFAAQQAFGDGTGG